MSTVWRLKAVSYIVLSFNLYQTNCYINIIKVKTLNGPHNNALVRSNQCVLYIHVHLIIFLEIKWFNVSQMVTIVLFLVCYGTAVPRNNYNIRDQMRLYGALRCISWELYDKQNTQIYICIFQAITLSGYKMQKSSSK